ncbi:hypothetical protein B566_EDAN013916 [Ephemera danica]|nr:hypothetical protein B566_EDAN013916 [Ephemera danica]
MVCTVLFLCCRLKMCYESVADWLDNGNNKKALQEADKVLKKQPNFLCAKVLRALALLRMGKNEECETILETVRTETPVDDATLQAMAICYRELHQTDKICLMYAAAVAKEPNNEELLTHLFMAHVRVGDFKKQQQTAMALFKLKPKNPYYFWGVMSVVMQAREVPEATARGLVLPLAERMVVKMVESGRVEAEQEVQLFLMILEMQDKIEEALQVLDGPLGERLVSHLGLVHTKKAALLARLGRWRESHLLYKTMIRQEQDRWNFYCEYMKTAFRLWAICPDDADVDEAEEGDDEDSPRASDKIWLRADTTPQRCAEFLSLLESINEERGEKRMRGPLLSKMELYSRLLECPQSGVEPQTVLGDLVDLVVAYFEPFGGKPCCFSDLRCYLPLLPEERAEVLASRLSDTFDMDLTQLPSTVAQLRRHISLMQLCRYLGRHEHLSAEAKVELVEDWLRRYDHGATLESGNIATDFPCADPYIQLVCHVLLELALQHGQDHRLLEAASILEHALLLSPSNFHFKLILLRIYSITGAGSAAQSTFELLDVKHMQLDSLGWLHCSHLSSTAHLAMASAHYEATLKFFTANYKDSVDHLTFSYKFGSFLKISEFVEFRDRLHRSHHYTRCTVERMLTELMLASSHEHATQVLHQMDVTPAEDSIEWDKLRDNRDLEVALTYDPPHKQISPEIVECTFRREIALLRLRSLQLRCIAAAFELLKPPCGHSSSLNNGECKENLLSTLITQILHFYLPPIPASKSEMNHPIPSRADSIAGSAHISAFVAGLRLANQLSEFSQDTQADPVPVLESMQPRVLCGLAELASRLRDVCGQLNDCVGRWESRVALADEAADLLGKWSLEEDSATSLKDTKDRSRSKVAEAVSAKLRHSYMASAKELQSLLTLKIKHLSQYTT